MTQSTWLSAGVARSSHVLLMGLLGLASVACTATTDGESSALDNLVHRM